MKIMLFLILVSLIVAVGFVAVLFSYPWQVMLAGVVAYLCAIPFAYRDWNRHLAGDAGAPAEVVPETTPDPVGKDENGPVNES